MGEADLPVPTQLETQLAKCKTVRRAAEYYKSREKSSTVSSFCPIERLFDKQQPTNWHQTSNLFKTFQEMEASKEKLPPLPAVSK